MIKSNQTEPIQAHTLGEHTFIGTATDEPRTYRHALGVIDDCTVTVTFFDTNTATFSLTAGMDFALAPEVAFVTSTADIILS